MITAIHATMHSWLNAHAVAVRDHVIVSTLVLALLLAVSMLPFIRPRTRYALVLSGVIKFLLPAAALTAFIRPFTGEEVALPTLSTTVLALPSTTVHSEILCAVALVWLAGMLVVAFRVLEMHRQSRAIIRTARTASARELEAMISIAGRSPLRTAPRVFRSGVAIPLTAGLLRPLVFLPERCADDLDDDELRAVLAHEIAHVERRHNLGALVLNAVTALFWFNPALWIASARLNAEAEKDCDERVLDFVPDPPAYLSGMLKVSYGFIAPQPAGVSCMSTLRLKERMDHLMKQQLKPARSVPHRLAIAFGAAAIALTTLVVSANPAKPVPAGKHGVSLPKLVNKVEPVYPPTARENRAQGTIIILATIDESGNVIETSIHKGIEGADGKALGEAAMSAVKQWKFEPALKNGKPVTVTYKITVRFKLS